MYTEETGLFSRIKGLFVSNEAVQETNYDCRRATGGDDRGK
jgi:hypothetical protein